MALITTARTGKAMTSITAHQPRFIRGSRTLSHEEAVEAVSSGGVVIVCVPDEDEPGMGDLRVTVTIGSDSAGDPYAYGKFPPGSPAAGRLDAAALEVYAAVTAVAASLCGDVNEILATW